MDKKEPKLAKDLAKKIYDDLKKKQIPDIMKFNKTFDEIFK
jgi:hypothetical protein